MALNIPSSVFTTYNDAVLLFTRTGTLVYPEKREDCPNCIMDTLGTRNRSMSIYQPGGPYPFERGMPCPYCNGKGYKATETTEDITLRVYWNRKYWVDIGIAVDIPDGSIQTISYMTDLPKINKAKFLIPKYDGIEQYEQMKFQRLGSSYPQGFKQNETKYVVTFWGRVDD
tara:strand:- start:91 stop:603 length:513 start_codon:yes stop_codon:yes gene_type:complete